MIPIIRGLLLFTSFQNVLSAPCIAELGLCLRPLIDTWEHIRNVEDHAANLIFPLPLYRRPSTLVLCEQYENVRRKCLTGDNCTANPMVTFVSQQLGFVCGPFLPLYMNNHECMSTTLLRNRQCLRHLHGMPNPFVSSVRCQSFSDYYDCAESFIEKKCGHEAALLLGGAVGAFGCKMEKGDGIFGELRAMNSSGEYTADALTGFFAANRPENYISLVTSAEVITNEPNLITTTEATPTRSATASSATDDVREYYTTPTEGKTESLGTTPTTSAEEDTTVTTTTNAQESTSSNEIENKTTSSSNEVDNNVSSPPNENAEEVPAEVVSTTVEQNFVEDERLTSNEVMEDETPTTAELTTEPSSTQTLSTSIETIPAASIFATSTEKQPNIVTVEQSVSVVDMENKTTTSDKDNNSTSLLGVIETFAVKREDAEPESKCSQEDEDYIRACHAHLLRRLAKIAPQESSLQVRFPLFSIPLQDVISLCKMYDEGNKCAADQLPHCDNMQMVRLIGSQLEAVCFRIDSMRRDYQCMQDTYEENPRCIAPITGVLDGDEDPCEGQQSSFDCFSAALECIPGARILAREMIRGYGCRVDVKRWLTKKPTTTTRTTTMSTTPLNVNSTDMDMDEESLLENVTSTISLSSPSTIETTTEATTTTTEAPTTEIIQFSSTEITEPLTTPSMINCHPLSRRTARMCMAPLLRTWDNLRQVKQQLKKSQFPIYKYTRTELLELCDGYANAFLCAGHDTIKKCIQDELVSFAQGHLGYQCSPQNLARFLSHYDCIIAVEESSQCRQLVVGEALPNSKNDRVCVDVSAYADCMTPLIANRCHPAAIMEFRRTIQQFGCRNVNDS